MSTITKNLGQNYNSAGTGKIEFQVRNPARTQVEETLTPTDSFVGAIEAKRPREGSSIAQMLEDIERAKAVNEKIAASAEGNLTQLDGATYATVLDDHLENAVMADAYRLAVQTVETESETHGKEHSHSHSNDAMLGGHLGTEVVEKIGHNAHHSASHSTDAVAHTVTEAKSQGASHLTDGVSHAVGHAKAETASKVAETAQDVAEVATNAHSQKAAQHLSTSLELGLQVSAGISGGLGAIMLYRGGKELKDGIKENDGEKVAEGVGGLAVGARSVAAASVMTSMVSKSAVVASVASVASKTLTPLGIVHGAIDLGLGVKDLTEGETTDGLIKVGFGASVIAGAAVGGIPLTVAAIGFLGAKVGRALHKGQKAKKEVPA